MFKVVASSKFTPLLLVGALTLILAACSSDSDDIQSATMAPLAATEAPPPTIAPTETPEPTVEIDPLRNPPDISVLPVRTLPSGLDPDKVSTVPSEEQVTQGWKEYLENTLIRFRKDLYHLCEDGSVYSATSVNGMAMEEGVPDSWSVGRNAAMSASRWWEVNFFASRNVYGRGYEQDTVEVFKVVDGVASMEDRELVLYESEFCEQLSS